MSSEEVGGDRPAEQSAGDDASHRRRDCQGWGAHNAGRLEIRRERETRRGPAGQRHRTGEHSKQWMLTECDGYARTDHVLKQRGDRGHHHHDQHEGTAAFEQQHAGTETD